MRREDAYLSASDGYVNEVGVGGYGLGVDLARVFAKD
jgi:hypothetical protein